MKRNKYTKDEIARMRTINALGLDGKMSPEEAKQVRKQEFHDETKQRREKFDKYLAHHKMQRSSASNETVQENKPGDFGKLEKVEEKKS